MITFNPGDKVVPRYADDAFGRTDSQYFGAQPYYIIEADIEGEQVVVDDVGMDWLVIDWDMSVWFEHYSE